MTTAAPDIRAHFGLSALPFTREFEVSRRFCHPSLEEALLALRQVIEQRMSGVLIAPAGTGKTLALRALVEDLPAARYRISYIKVTGVGKREMCREIAVALGCASAGQYNTLIRRLQEHLVSVTAQDGVRPVILIDEAHDMPPEVLSLFRILTNFELDSRLVVSVLLVGQPKLTQMLKRDELEALSRRLAHVAVLRNLSREEARAYILHRTALVGARTELFGEMAVEALHELARGNLRATDTLAFKALHIAAAAKSSVVDANHVALARSQVLS